MDDAAQANEQITCTFSVCDFNLFKKILNQCINFQWLIERLGSIVRYKVALLVLLFCYYSLNEQKTISKSILIWEISIFQSWWWSCNASSRQEMIEYPTYLQFQRIFNVYFAYIYSYSVYLWFHGKRATLFALKYLHKTSGGV